MQFGQLRSLLGHPFANNKMCLHPDAPRGCGKVIRAHTLQRSGIIRTLIGTDNRVCTFYPVEPDHHGDLRIHDVGWRQASTFHGFCESHDGELFSAIEKKTFVSTARQRLLVGYRALCHEIYQKHAATDADPLLMKTLDRGLPGQDQRVIQTMLMLQSAGRQRGLEELRAVKSLYDHILRAEDYSLLHSAVLRFEGNPCVASTGTVHVDFDLRGNRMQNLARDPSPIHGLTFGVVATLEGCAFVATWPAEFRYCDCFIRSLLSYPPADVPSVLTEFFFAYVENTYFSRAWWSALPDVNRRRVKELAGIAVQYGNPLQYSGLQHLGWKLTETDLNLG